MECRIAVAKLEARKSSAMKSFISVYYPFDVFVYDLFPFMTCSKQAPTRASSKQKARAAQQTAVRGQDVTETRKRGEQKRDVVTNKDRKYV